MLRKEKKRQEAFAGPRTDLQAHHAVQVRVDEESDVVVGEVEEPEVAEAPEGVLADGRDVGVRDVDLLQLGQRGEDRAEDEGVGLVLGRGDGQDLRGERSSGGAGRRRGGDLCARLWPPGCRWKSAIRGRNMRKQGNTE